MKKLLLTILSLFYFSTTFANTSPYGVNFSYVLMGKDPDHVHGYRASFIYEPPTWEWSHVHIFFDTSLGHWWVTDTTPYKSLNIFSAAPVLRYYFKDYEIFQPFLDLSIGLAYLSKTRLDDRNLGMHFAFQDQIGFGTTLGRTKQFTLSISALHYSNGSMSAMNAGISAPLMLNIGYRF